MENQIWYDVSGTPTKLTDIKYGSFHYHADVGVSGKMRLGNVCSAFIEFDYLLSNGVTFSIGDALQYKQNFPEQDQFFDSANTDYVRDRGTYYVTSIDDDGKICHVTAFDAITKLDVDFSKRLKELEPSFPMSISNLLNEVASVAGVTIDVSVIGAGSNFVNSTVNYFFSNAITCRDVVKAVAEMGSVFVKASITGTIKFEPGFGMLFPTLNRGYIICPDDGTYICVLVGDNTAQLTNVWYKENGLRLGEPISLYDAAYEYDSRGNVVSYRVWNNVIPLNVYEFFVANNILVHSGITWPTYYSLALYLEKAITFVFGAIDSLLRDPYDFVSGTIRLFPFRNPFNVGDCTLVVDADGNYHLFPIMSLDLSESEVVIESYSDKTVGAEAQNGVGSGGEDRSLALDVRVTALESESEQKGSDLLLSQLNVPATATSYACDWANYDILIINGMFYGNTVSSYVVTKDYFNGTMSGGRVMVIDPVNGNIRYAVYKKDNENIYALTESGTPGAAYGIRIYGVKL